MARVRDNQDDVMARGAAERAVADFLDVEPNEEIGESAATPSVLVSQIAETVEFEKATFKGGGREIGMRRVVITGAWEVDPGQS
jgi:hypothetical protein